MSLVNCTYRLISNINFSSIKICFRFDWSGKKPLLYNEKVSLRAQPIATGVAHAIFMWWDLNMNIDKQVIVALPFFQTNHLFRYIFHTFLRKYCNILLGFAELCTCVGTSRCP